MVSGNALVIGLATLQFFECIYDGNPSGLASDLTVTISWGDDTTTTDVKPLSSASGTGCKNPGWDFMVAGSHIWAKAGRYDIRFTVKSAGGATATGSYNDFLVKPWP